MIHSITIIEGPGKGRRATLQPGRTLLGRSKDADFVLEASSRSEEDRISRSHVEIWIKDDQAYVKDLSRNGTLLEGKALAKSAQISINHGEKLTVADITILYEGAKPAAELGDPNATQALSADEATRAMTQDTMDPTVAAEAHAIAERQRNRRKPVSAGPDSEQGTKVLSETDETKVISEDVWAPGNRKPAEQRSGLIRYASAALVVILALAYLKLSRNNPSGPEGRITYKNADCSLQHPANWIQDPGSPSQAYITTGRPDTEAWARITIRVEKSTIYKHAGMTRGFALFVDEISKPNTREIGRQRMRVNNADVVHFRFEIGATTVRGLYVPNGDTRITVLAECPTTSYADMRSSQFTEILESFRLTGDARQVYVDYTSDDREAAQIALTNPGLLSDRVRQELLNADSMWEHRDVRLDMLHGAVKGYRKAVQLCLAPQSPLVEYSKAAEKLFLATDLLNSRVATRFFQLEVAQKQGHKEKALRIIDEIEMMIPDSSDPLNQRAKRVSDHLRSNSARQ
ncbi:MAG: FHA domain-containing protein [Verrucomicrobia bacterium]|nr:FHA domain-containing protein [Verrucomicrobiota bacterium]